MALQSVSLATAGRGTSLAAFGNSSQTDPILAVKSLIAGPGINLIAGDSGVDVTISVAGLPMVRSVITSQVHWIAGNNLNNTCHFIAAFPVVVTAIIARLEISNAQVSNLSVLKVLNGQPISSGIPIIMAPFATNDPPYISEVLPLVANNDALSLAIGDSLAIQVSSSLTGAGSMTIFCAPLSP